MNRTILLLAAALVATPAFAVDPTGIPQCDELLRKYETCSEKLPPERVHSAHVEILEGATSIRGAAPDPKLRAELERYCTERFDQMKHEGDIKECMSK